MADTTFETLVDAHLKARRFRTAAEELRDWHARRLEGLRKLFGVLPLDAAALEAAGPDSSVIARVCNDCLEQSVSARSPFSGFLEIPARGPLRELIDRRSSALFAAEHAYQEQIRATLADGLGVLFPEARGRVFTVAEMEAAGLGEAEPDEYDWF